MCSTSGFVRCVTTRWDGHTLHPGSSTPGAAVTAHLGAGPPEPRLSTPVKLEEPAWSALVSGNMMSAPTLGAHKSCPSEIYEACGW